MDKENPVKLTEARRGKSIVQLDYFTNEYVDEYYSLTELCKDYNLSHSTVSGAFNRKRSLILLPKHELMFMLKSDYEKMLLSGLEAYYGFNLEKILRLAHLLDDLKA